MSTLATLFVTGLTLGVSQCLLSCAPMLVFYVAGTNSIPFFYLLKINMLILATVSTN
jgi:hypothetical protein